MKNIENKVEKGEKVKSGMSKLRSKIDKLGKKEWKIEN